MELLVVILSSALGGGLLTTVVTALFNKRKTDADASNATVEAAAKIVSLYSKTLEEMQDEIRTLKDKVQQLELMLKEKELEVASLRQQRGL